ncbi:MAG: hypothetical protein ACRD0D_02195 [Acidimicrobiales bacterium]
MNASPDWKAHKPLHREFPVSHHDARQARKARRPAKPQPRDSLLLLPPTFVEMSDEDYEAAVAAVADLLDAVITVPDGA